MSRICQYFLDWLFANSLAHNNENSSRHLPSCWQRPNLGTIKLNSDAGSLHQGRVSIGGVIRDHLGRWLLGFKQLLPLMSILEAESEMRSIYTGLMLLLQNGFTNVLIENDSSEAVNLLSAETQPFHPLKLLIRDCK